MIGLIRNNDTPKSGIKVAAIANAMEQYNAATEKLHRDQMDLIESRFLDVAHGVNDPHVKRQEVQVEKDKASLRELLDTDIDDVPLIHPEFGVNCKKGNCLDILG